MDREYLEDYNQKEEAENKRFLEDIREERFDFEKDRFPPDERFVNPQKPMALASLESTKFSNLWAQVPFCGSLLIFIPASPQDHFENFLFKVSEIPKIVDFIKETGRLQVALSSPPTEYYGLDYLDPFFKELNPPYYHVLPPSILGTEKELKNAATTFFTLAQVRYRDYITKIAQKMHSRVESIILNSMLQRYIILKLGRYLIVEEIENLMIDNPERADSLLAICSRFIANPLVDLRADLMNFTLKETRTSEVLPIVYQPEEIRFPCEIGKFLLRKLTYAAQDVRACYNIIDDYDDYDLQKIQKSLNEAIVTNHPDIVNKSVEELSEILDNVWNDQTIPKRIQNIKVGLPVSIAAIGGVAGGLVGGLTGVGAGGFLAELGFKVTEKAVEKLFSVKGEELSEKPAKLRTKSYQANIYDFKKKYKHRIAKE